MEPTVCFTETMRGFVSNGECECERGFRKGRADKASLAMTLDIEIGDLDEFIADPEHWADATGVVEGVAVRGRCDAKGRVGLLGADPDRSSRRLMRYELTCTDVDGVRRILSGVKHVEDDPGIDFWADTTGLFVKIYEEGAGRDGDPCAAGRITIGLVPFLRLLCSMFCNTLRDRGAKLHHRIAAAWRFNRFFLGGLWEVYAPKKIADWRRTRRWIKSEREIPIFTIEGVENADVSTHYFSTEDGLTLSLLRFRAHGAKPCTDSVLLHHGLTSSSDMFLMPEHRNLVTYLLENGFEDVWCLDSRMSGRHPFNLRRHRHTLDDVALYDHPAAVDAIREEIGDGRLHVISHCLGSTSFMMSLFAQKVTGVSSVVCNSVALAPRVSRWSRIKIAVSPPILEYVFNIAYMSPRWREDVGLTIGEIVARVTSFVHRDCDVPECHMLSLMWGSGCPALWNHANLDERTHRRLGDLFSGTGVHYYRHIHAMVRSDSTAVKYDKHEPRHRSMPNNYFEHAAALETPVLFLSGEQNNVFADSNPLCYERLYALDPTPGKHLYDLKMIPDYGHQDVFMGREAATDVFPHILEFIRMRGPGVKRPRRTTPKARAQRPAPAKAQRGKAPSTQRP